jgi:small subunit ribosomal protein S16
VAVKIRLMRVGKKKQPTYRVVVADSRSPRNGRFIEIIGQYEPRSEPSGFNVDASKALAWLEKGAQPTEQVLKLLVANGTWDEFVKVRPNAAKVTAKQALRAKAPTAKPVAEAPAAQAAAPEEAPAEEAPAAEAPAEEAAAEAPAEEAAAEAGDA